MEVLFCICPNAGATDEQLLETGLFPSSLKNIETVFAFSALDDLLIDNLECKTTAQQYYSKLQHISNQMFPDHVPVRPQASINVYNVLIDSYKNLYKQLLRASHQWHNLSNRVQSGLGHQHKNDPINVGSMAIFCPACPQPGINLPDDWQQRYTSYGFIKILHLIPINHL